MSREDDVRELRRTGALSHFACNAIADFVDARIREAMGGHLYTQDPPWPKPASVEPAATASANTYESTGRNVTQSAVDAAIRSGSLPTSMTAPEPPCSCAAIQAADPARHFKGCARRVEKEAPYKGDLHWRLTEIVDSAFGPIPTAPIEELLRILENRAEEMRVVRASENDLHDETIARAEPEAKPQPAAVGPEPPKQVTMLQRVGAYGPADWMYIDGPDWYPANFRRATYVLASEHAKAIAVLRALRFAVREDGSNGVTEDVYQAAVELLAEYDSKPT